MPQLDFATYASQIFWLAITFGLLYLIMAKSALPTIREVLHNRQSRISEDLKKAENLKTEAESAQADFTSVITSARNNASAILHKERERATRESDERHAKLDETFSRQNKESEHRIEIIKKEAKETMEPIAVDAAIDIIKKITGMKADKKKVKEATLKISNNA